MANIKQEENIIIHILICSETDMETATDYQHNCRLDKGATDVSTADFLLICIRTNTISSQCYQLLNIIETSPPSIVHNREAPEGREPKAPVEREPSN